MTALEQLLLAGYTVLGAVVAYLFRQLQRAQAKEAAALREVLPLAQELLTTVGALQTLVEKIEKRRS